MCSSRGEMRKLSEGVTGGRVIGRPESSEKAIAILGEKDGGRRQANGNLG